MANKIIIKLEHPYEVLKSREGQKIEKVSSSISPITLVKLLNIAENKINPHTAKAGPITKAIFETLDKSPELFWYKSKGILLASTELRKLDRNRIELSFDQSEYEGIMDGGHNALAIANFITTVLFDHPLKNWDECKRFWEQNYNQIVTAYEERMKENPERFAFSIPIEIIAPSLQDGAIEDFYNAIAEICAARNNNVQLKETAKGNQEGYYDYLKQKLHSYSIIWKTNEKGDIKAEDVITMADIPLIFLQSQELVNSDIKLNPVNLYSGKGQCIKFFGNIVGRKEYSDVKNGKSVLTNELIKSALDMTEDIMKFFDLITLNFPKLYNDACRGRFGGISAVKAGKEMEVLFHTKRKKCDSTYPHSFFYPLIAGVTSLMKYNEDANRLEWIVNPASEDKFDLSKIDLSRYTEMMKLLNYNPNVIGKTALMYDLARDAYNNLKNIAVR
ncbi:MAG: hypothetical protein LKE54_10350 [Prevotella sp.]|jgi:hypothetical protein|nr:hypothetical protein [Prevotella sp.]MCH3995420.1 hypothetical protein [Prevotella sp.]